tara:strand:+ start:266 stop:400 length:135 start_codon:yes stop_codon:yes gene_type:complete
MILTGFHQFPINDYKKYLNEIEDEIGEESKSKYLEEIEFKLKEK